MSLTKPTIDLRSPADPPRDERTIGQLVADINTEVSGLVRAELALAKAEIKQDALRGGIGAGLLGGAALFGLTGFFLLWFTLAYVLVQLGLQTWAAFGIVTFTLFALAGIMALVGKSRLEKISGPKQTISTTKDSIERVKAAATNGA